MADLVWHVGGVHEFFGAVVREQRLDPNVTGRATRPDSFAGIVDFGQRMADQLVQVLTDTDPAAPAWSWTADQTAGFVTRRMTHETAVHRLDAEQAAANTFSIDAELASDGVDEFLSNFLIWAAPDAAPVDGSVHLHCTDVAGEWLVKQSADAAYEVTREHAKGDAAIRGRAEDLLLVLWRRLSLDTAEVIGDRGAADRLIARTRL